MKDFYLGGEKKSVSNNKKESAFWTYINNCNISQYYYFGQINAVLGCISNETSFKNIVQYLFSEVYHIAI